MSKAQVSFKEQMQKKKKLISLNINSPIAYYNRVKFHNSAANSNGQEPTRMPCLDALFNQPEEIIILIGCYGFMYIVSF